MHILNLNNMSLIQKREELKYKGDLSLGLQVLKARNHKPVNGTSTQPNDETKSWSICAAVNLKVRPITVKVKKPRKGIITNHQSQLWIRQQRPTTADSL